MTGTANRKSALWKWQETGTAEYCDEIARPLGLCRPGNWPSTPGLPPHPMTTEILILAIYNGEGSANARLSSWKRWKPTTAKGQNPPDIGISTNITPTPQETTSPDRPHAHTAPARPLLTRAQRRTDCWCVSGDRARRSSALPAWRWRSWAWRGTAPDEHGTFDDGAGVRVQPRSGFRRGRRNSRPAARFWRWWLPWWSPGRRFSVRNAFIASPPGPSCSRCFPSTVDTAQPAPDDILSAWSLPDDRRLLRATALMSRRRSARHSAHAGLLLHGGGGERPAVRAWCLPPRWACSSRKRLGTGCKGAAGAARLRVYGISQSYYSLFCGTFRQNRLSTHLPRSVPDRRRVAGRNAD